MGAVIPTENGGGGVSATYLTHVLVMIITLVKTRFLHGCKKNS